MAASKVERITRKQARKQISVICFPLLLYSVCSLMLQYIPVIFEDRLETAFPSIDIELTGMCISIAVCIFIALIPMRIASHILDLDFRAYLRKAKMNGLRRFCLCCIGVAIYFGLTSLCSGVHFLFHSLTSSYAFLGHFTTIPNIIRNLVYFLCFIIVKPLAEEYIFRAVAQRQLGHYSRFFGVLASAFLYAMVQPTFGGEITAFFFGWYLALVTLRYHSIYPAMYIHVSAALFSWLIAIVPSRWILLPTVLIVIVYIVTMLVLVTGAIRLNIVHPEAREGRLWKIFLKTVPVILCILIFLGGAVLSFVY